METIIETKRVVEEHLAEIEDWDLVIEPKSAWLSLNLSEVWQYRDLLWLFVKRDFAAQYKQTVLGPVWHFIQPALTTGLFLLVFGNFVHVSTDGMPPVLFFLSGIALWNYFAACFTNTANTFVANAGIFGKVYFPRLVIPLSIVLSNMVRFCIQFVLLAMAMVYYAIFQEQTIVIGLHTLLIPVLMLLMAGMGLGLGIIVSSLTTKYRDFTVLLGFGVQLLMYATPVAYPLSFLNGKSFSAIVKWNPLSPVVEGFRYALFNTGTFAVSSLLYSVLFMLCTLLIGIVSFNRAEKTFIDTV